MSGKKEIWMLLAIACTILVSSPAGAKCTSKGCFPDKEDNEKLAKALGGTKITAENALKQEQMLCGELPQLVLNYRQKEADIKKANEAIDKLNKEEIPKATEAQKKAQGEYDGCKKVEEMLIKNPSLAAPGAEPIDCTKFETALTKANKDLKEAKDRKAAQEKLLNGDDKQEGLLKQHEKLKTQIGELAQTKGKKEFLDAGLAAQGKTAADLTNEKGDVNLNSLCDYATQTRAACNAQKDSITDSLKKATNRNGMIDLLTGGLGGAGAIIAGAVGAASMGNSDSGSSNNFQLPNQSDSNLDFSDLMGEEDGEDALASADSADSAATGEGANSPLGKGGVTTTQVPVMQAQVTSVVNPTGQMGLMTAAPPPVPIFSTPSL